MAPPEVTMAAKSIGLWPNWSTLQFGSSGTLPRTQHSTAKDYVLAAEQLARALEVHQVPGENIRDERSLIDSAGCRRILIRLQG